jgi:hypothetical protein
VTERDWEEAKNGNDVEGLRSDGAGPGEDRAGLGGAKHDWEEQDGEKRGQSCEEIKQDWEETEQD